MIKLEIFKEIQNIINSFRITYLQIGAAHTNVIPSSDRSLYFCLFLMVMSHKIYKNKINTTWNTPTLGHHEWKPELKDVEEHRIEDKHGRNYILCLCLGAEGCRRAQIRG